MLAIPTSSNSIGASNSMSLLSTSSSSSSPSAYNLPRSTHISEEVKFQRQRIDPSKAQPEIHRSGKYNTLTMLSNTSTKLIPRSVGLYFYRRGFKAGFHGSPTLLDFNRFQQIPDWQQYLKNLVLQHTAWLSYPNIKSYELHPRLPICVGYWDGTTTGIAPNANISKKYSPSCITYISPCITW